MPTALELEREDWRRYQRCLYRRSAPRQPTPEEQRERDRLLARARELAKMLKRQFGVRKVVLFGSLARMSWFTPGSDVDLAVEGLETREYWRAWKLAEEIIADRPVDFVEIESVSDSLKKAIDRYGVEL
jgi:predicted nucleotidyltransferase